MAGQTIARPCSTSCHTSARDMTSLPRMQHLLMHALRPALFAPRTQSSRVAHASKRSFASTAAVPAGSNKQSGYMYHELLFWHTAGPWGNLKEHVQPMKYPENAETKRRLHNLLNVSGLLDDMKLIKPRQATVEELCRCAVLPVISTAACASIRLLAGATLVICSQVCCYLRRMMRHPAALLCHAATTSDNQISARQ